MAVNSLTQPANMSTTTGPVYAPAVAPPVLPTVGGSGISKSTAVVSSNTAANNVNSISGHVDDAKTAIDNQAATSAAAIAANPYSMKPGETADAYNARVADYNATKNAGTTTEQTPEQQIANTPETGNKFVYDVGTGERSEVPTAQPLTSTQTTTNVATAPAVDTAMTGSSTIKQFSDGTYGMFDNATGKYIGGASSLDFNNAKGAQKAQSDLVAIQNGTYPLTSGQQSQLTNLQNTYNDLIEAQKTENANTLGNATSINNLYGIAGSSVGVSNINKVIADGSAKIAKLNAELVDKVSALQDAIKTDDINLVTKIYTGYKQGVDDKQAEIDKMDKAAADAKSKQEQNQASVNDSYARKYMDTTTPILSTDTAAEVAAKLATSPSYQQDQKTKQGVVDQDVLDGMLAIYKKTQQVPAGMGTASVALKKAFYAAIGGQPGLVDEAAQNKAAIGAATAALKTQQTQYSANQTSVGTIKSSMDRVENYLKPLVDTGSPLLNGPLRAAQGKGLGSSDYSAFENEINTIATEYAKIISGASASIAGVSVSTVDDVKQALNDKVNLGQLESVLGSMKADINARSISQKGTIDRISQDIHDMGSTGSSSSGGSDPAGLGI